MQPAIVVHNISKRFPHYDSRRRATLHAALAGGLRWRILLGAAGGKSHWRAWSKMPGVIGANGVGKSTLLKLISGIGRPDEGFINTRGRISALFDLTAGFTQISQDSKTCTSAEW
jgi:ABC-type uncharacterized transport system ATPase subunit